MVVEMAALMDAMKEHEMDVDLAFEMAAAMAVKKAGYLVLTWVVRKAAQLADVSVGWSVGR